MNEQQFDALPPVTMPEQGEASMPENAPAPVSEKETTKALEAPAQGMVSPAAASVSAVPPPISIPSGVLQPPANTTPAQAATALSSSLIAEDADLIEKEWVEKAKQIVEQTKHDPYKQNEEINKVKADYLKKRYNRDLNVGKP